MNCYCHQDNTAVGVCKYCYKALCTDCAVDMESGLACTNHVEKVKRIEELVEQGLRSGDLNASKIKYMWP